MVVLIEARQARLFRTRMTTCRCSRSQASNVVRGVLTLAASRLYDGIPLPGGPSSRPNCALVCAAGTLNATGQSPGNAIAAVGALKSGPWATPGGKSGLTIAEKHDPRRRVAGGGAAPRAAAAGVRGARGAAHGGGGGGALRGPSIA